MPTIKSTVKWDGEKEFKQTTHELNGELTTLRSEMTKVSEQFRENSDSVEALSAKNDVLKRQLETQQKKVDALRTAHQKAAEAYGESDTRTQKWAQQLNYAEAAVYKTTRAIEGNNEALAEANEEYDELDSGVENASEETVGLSGVVDQIANKFGFTLPEGMSKSIDGLGSISSGLAASVAGALALVAAIVKLEDALADITKERAESADETMTLSKQYGVSTDLIQELNYSTNLIDVSTQNVTTSIAKLTMTMSDARKGGNDYSAAFEKLGISVVDTNGELRDSEEVFWEVIDALGSVENETERNALLLKIFGESASYLNPIIEEGSGGFREYAKEAHNVAYVMDSETLAVMQALQDAVDRSDEKSKAAANTLAVRYAPALTEFTEEWSDLKLMFANIAADSGLVDMLAMLLDIVNSIFQLLKPLIALVSPLSEGLIQPLAWALGLVADAISVICNGLAALIELIGAVIRLLSSGSWKYNMEYLNNLGNTFTNGFTANYIRGNASGTDNFTGGFTWVNEDGPEKVVLPSGAQIIPSREASGGYGPIYVTIDAKNVREFNDVVRIAEDARMSQRQGYAGG